MNQKKEDSFRRGIERKLHSVAESLEKEFPELSEAQKSTILTVMSVHPLMAFTLNMFGM